MEIQTTVGEYLINQLYSLNVKHIFGIPGDYVLGFYDQLSNSKIKTIITCDEQGAGFAADAYARLNGIGAVCVTYCVGGLKLLNTTAEAYAEKSAVVIISGSPGISERKNLSLLHHKVKDYDTQYNIFKNVTVASTVLDDINIIPIEIERVLSSAIQQKLPVYIEIPRDMIYKVVKGPQKCNIPDFIINPKAMREVLDETANMINNSNNPVVVAGVEIQRFGLQNYLLEFLNKTSIPVVSTPLSKSVLSENHPMYLGVYEGAIGYQNVRQYVEQSDCVLILGSFITDFDFGNSPTPVDQEKTINAMSSKIYIKYHNFDNIPLKEYLKNLCKINIKKFPINNKIIKGQKTKILRNKISNEKITVNGLFTILNDFITAENIVIADVGDSLFGGLDLFIHKGTEFISPAFYLSMGFAIPASLGAQLSNPNIRPIVLVGDGAFQMTGMELSTIAKENLNPIIVLLNNDGYRTERNMLDGPFNNLYCWNYSKITEIMGKGNSYIVETEKQLETALSNANKNLKEFSLIEVRLDRWDSSNALTRLTNTFGKKIKEISDHSE
ncbi:MAG TPA: thiamine pyrophosphate-binding protein [Nitrososphaeraceae archaeon]|nr:thiamine pyrophosphate-binding protein [Nitrososphaeraceae archaeon]